MSAELPNLPAVGTCIGEGRFELLAKLGEGGMSGVFRAWDHHRDREVALKLLLPRYLGRPEREQRIINEGEYLGRLQGHPNIVERHDCGRLSDHGWPWLTTQLLRGEVLDWLLVRSKIEANRVIDIARQVATALEHCHQNGVVHRDTTPGNLFMLADGTVKLFDFSHAGDLRHPQLTAGAPGRLTGSHDTPGTIGYMGPEQAAKAPADPAMDVFGFGALLFELITRRNPFRQFVDRDEFIRAQRDAAIEVPRIHAWAYEVPEQLAAIVRDCTLRAACERPSIGEVIERLAAIDMPESAPRAVATPARPSEPSSLARGPTRRRGLLVLTVGALCVLTVGGWAMLTNDAAPKHESTPRPAEAAPEPESRPPRPDAAPMLDVSVNPTRTTGPTCDGVEGRGRAAFARRRWRDVLAHTARNTCWSSKHERLLLRTTALFNLGRWGECARLGAKSRDPKIRSLADACEATAKPGHPESK